MTFQRPEGGWRFNFGGLKTNTAADEMPPTKYPYAKNVRYVKSLQTRPGYDLLFTTTLIIITTCPLHDGEVGVPYETILEGDGGVPPYVWTIESGSLPDGLTLDPDGTISGTPTTEGLSTFVILLTDSEDSETRKSCQTTILPAVAITTTCPLPDGEIDAAYDQQMEATGGVEPYVWSISSGSLPDGLSMDADGHITGTPTTDQVSTFTLHVEDDFGGIDEKSCQITINIPCFNFSDDFNRANGPLGANYSTILASSGVDPAIVSNQFNASAVSTSEVVAAPAANPAGYSEVTWSVYTSVAWGGPMALRHTNGINNDYYILKAEDVGGLEPRGKLTIVRSFNTGVTVLATLSPTLLSGLIGVPLRLEWDVQVTKTVLTAYVNGVQVLTADDSDADRFTVGKPGIAVITSSGLTANAWENYSCHSCP